MATLDQLTFNNRFVDQLPADPEPSNTRRQVEQAFYSNVLPTPVVKPQLVAGAVEVAELIGLDAAEFDAPKFASVFGGNEVLPGMQPHAMCYGGHQFGHWAGQLGDGRAINLGDRRGADGDSWTLQLKGAGPTPYSRMADGLAVLRSSVREFLCSEAMHHLGVPTTRALSLTLTGDQVWRDMFYDGRAAQEPGAVVCRVARSFVRMGSFELPASRGDVELVRQLADTTIRWHFGHLLPASGELGPEVYAAWFRELLVRNVDLVVHWMRVGFVHGVLNTDNLSILGETIDYGPYGWLEGYDPGWTPNTTDGEGKRYAYGNQPAVVHWNLTRLASAIVPLVGAVEPLQEAVNSFQELYQSRYLQMLAGKLGLVHFDPATDTQLLEALLRLLAAAETDMTVFFRGLCELSSAETDSTEAELELLGRAMYREVELTAGLRGDWIDWFECWRGRVRVDGRTDEDRGAAMRAVNPAYVLRNYLAQVAIDKAAGGDFSEIAQLLDVLRRPYEEQAGAQRFAQMRPEWARHKPGCSMLSCSS